jgi:hypothetical protein
LKNHQQVIESSPHLTTTALGKQLGVSASTVWRVRKTLGLESNGKRGTQRKDRSTWDWSMKNIELARTHGLSRQRISILRKVYGKALPSAKKGARNERETRSDRGRDHAPQEAPIQASDSAAVEQSA